jgi:hypothetical protein
MAAMRSAIFQASFFLRTRSRLVQSTRARLLTRPPSARRDAPCPRGAPPHLSSPEEGHACRSHCARRGSTNLNVKIRSIPCAALREHRSDMRGLAPHVPSASTRTDQADPSHSGVRVRRAKETNSPRPSSHPPRAADLDVGAVYVAGFRTEQVTHRGDRIIHRSDIAGGDAFGHGGQFPSRRTA